MDRKEALRILNLIGATSQQQTSMRYYELRASIEILIEKSETAQLRHTYRECAQSLEEAYELLMQGREAKLLTSGSEASATTSETETVTGEAGEALSQIRSALSEVNQIRSYLQKYSALLEIQLAKADEVIKKAEAQNEGLDALAGAVQKLRVTAACNVNEIASHLENAKKLTTQIQQMKGKLEQPIAPPNWKRRIS
jgi:hypothetical protein